MSTKTHFKVKKLAHDIWVIDNFFKDYKSVYNFALSQDYSKHKNDKYFGNNSSSVFIPSEVLVELPKLLKKKFHLSFNKTKTYDPASCGRFRLSYQTNNQGDTVIHQDYTSDWSLVVYLNPIPDSSGGTYFMEHFSGVRSAEEYELTKKLIKDESQWRVWANVSLAPNRAILFNSRYYHRIGKTFGKTKETARLTNIYWLHKGHSKNGINSY